jgi:hypothetical protein
MVRFGSAICVVLLLAACGGDDSATATPEDPPPKLQVTTPSSTTTSTTKPSTTSSSSSSTTSTSSTTTSTSIGGTTSSTMKPISTNGGGTLLAKDRIPQQSVGYGVDIEPATVNGVSYPTALVTGITCSSSPRTESLEIDAGRAEKRFTGDLGIRDDQTSDSLVHVEVAVDDNPPIFVDDVAFGQTKKLDLDISGGLRVRISYQSKTVRCQQSATVVVVGQPTLVS